VLDSIDFNEIKELFNPTEWDVAYVSADNFKKGGVRPIKHSHHFKGVPWAGIYEDGELVYNINDPTPYNGIIVAKYTEEANNYEFYEESNEILDIKYRHNYNMVYVNFKEVALLSGFGHRARNSLIYNRKFGFQCKLCTYMFIPPIVNYESLEPNTDLLDLCDGCDDCIVNCPAAAIFEDRIDHIKCDNYIAQDIKWFWYEKMRPNISKEEVGLLETTHISNYRWGKGVDGFYEVDGYKLKKDGRVIEIPHCRECQKQPRCSKSPYFLDNRRI